MTQKELAELVNVSDKAVSRWERDESMPDILLIPVLADIFEAADKIHTCLDLLAEYKYIEPQATLKETYEKVKAFNKPNSKYLGYIYSKKIINQSSENTKELKNVLNFLNAFLSYQQQQSP